MIYVVCDEQDKVYGTFTANYTLTQTKDNFVLKQDEDITFLFPLSFNLYQAEGCPDDVNSVPYMYTPESGFVKLPEPEPDQPDPNYGVDPATVEQIQADYREKLAKEVANYGYNA